MLKIDGLVKCECMFYVKGL